MKEVLRREWAAFRLLLRSVPPFLTALLALALFSMNLLANKSIALGVSWLALDCGILVSWFVFLAMDMITKHFGPKAANELSVLAVAIDLLLCGVFAVAGSLPGVWGESFVAGSEAVINAALDRTFGGTWYVVAGSTAAFLVSAFVNNFVNWGVGRLLRRSDGFGVYAARSYLSTAVGQFTDNLVFALLVSHVFFGWSLVQCFTCALTGMAAELLCEVVFSGLGYRTCRRWREQGVGAEYLTYLAEKGGTA